MDNKLKSSTTMKYFADIMEMVLMYTEDISVLETQLPGIISLVKSGIYIVYNWSTIISNQEKSNILGIVNYNYVVEELSAPLGSVMEWLEPYKELSKLDYSCSAALAKSFHSYVEQLPKIEVGLVSCLRVMCKIALAPDNKDVSGFVCEELSYQRALLDLYSEDCLSGWIKILEVKAGAKLLISLVSSVSNIKNIIL